MDMTQYVVHYEPVDVIADSVEEAIKKAKDLAPDICRVEPTLLVDMSKIKWDWSEHKQIS